MGLFAVVALCAFAFLLLLGSASVTWEWLDFLNRRGAFMNRRTASHVLRTLPIPDRVIVWGIFVFAGALVPTALVWYLRRDAGLATGIPEILSTGELILIAIVLIIGSLGDLIISLFRRPIETQDVLAFSIFVAMLLVGTTIYISKAAVGIDEDPHGNSVEMTVASIVMLTCAGIGGAGIVWRISREVK